MDARLQLAGGHLLAFIIAPFPRILELVGQTRSDIGLRFSEMSEVNSGEPVGTPASTVVLSAISRHAMCHVTWQHVPLRTAHWALERD